MNLVLFLQDAWGSQVKSLILMLTPRIKYDITDMQIK